MSILLVCLRTETLLARIDYKKRQRLVYVNFSLRFGSCLGVFL